jgi:bifunctional non-homologous end joining protein LigD
MPEKTTRKRARADLRAQLHPGTEEMKKSPAKGKAEPRGQPAEAKLVEYRRKRDFTRTQEPKGGSAKAHQKLAFVIQKHAARNLHYDLRLELDGVMKSWAVPKGPSLDPSVKRLAMEVEDHPIEYNAFEGIIPKGEYGGGTVMLWDRGTYTYGGSEAGDPVDGLRRGYAKGDFKFVLNGKRLRGSWVLVRTRRDPKGRAQWLLIKHRDEYAKPGSDVTAEHQTSVATRRSMEEIAGTSGEVWHSNRTESAPEPSGTGSAYQRLMARRTR